MRLVCMLVCWYLDYFPIFREFFICKFHGITLLIPVIWLFIYFLNYSYMVFLVFKQKQISKVIVVTMKIRAKPIGLAGFILSLVGETAKPVIEGSLSKILRRAIIDTPFSTKTQVFMVYLLTISKPTFIFFVFSVYYVHK